MKSILKHSRSLEPDEAEDDAGGVKGSGVAGAGGETKRQAQRSLKWDEENLKLTEAQKCAKMKITEPKTPFQRTLLPDDDVPEFSLDDSDNGMSVDEPEAPAETADEPSRLSAAEPDSVDHDASAARVRMAPENADSPAKDDADAAKKQRFEQMRKMHYMGMAKAPPSSDEEESEDDDE
ncbi:protein phosphatase regulatory subunit Glc9 [Schizosaccharomyces japonicus yFS275]|uniref:Protein phosphatase regulatory subunit Glc9 n=1 Tax=Schizosaccharomyces japonicus (strain yFS275 / FY16936) TaxID=402676 RepID=B6K3T0_SCHJY|nr:protein phosphatase regulatory subunit Glc9 [Schizosaccharomyces japonicus yFS275]EEB08137.1 protein phosphatase regulatory subunit Glc9 [Schizosaccharomyces japonicus yFS275]